MIGPQDVSIIMPVWGKNPEERYALKESLTSILETCECQIVVVLNGGLMAPEEVPQYERVRVVEVPEQGQCRAVNIGAAMTDTPWVMVTNDDHTYPPGWFEKLVAHEVPCVSPLLIEPRSGAPTFEVYFCGGAGGDFDKDKFLSYARNRNPAIHLRTGFNLPFLISRELWDTVGGYDENFDPWGSNGDSDLEYKIRLAGVMPRQCPPCGIYHFSQTSGTSHPDNRPYWDKNWHYFIEKWGFERASSPEIWTATFEIPMEKLKYKPEWVGKYGPIQQTI